MAENITNGGIDFRFVHGFLGRPQDGDGLWHELKAYGEATHQTWSTIHLWRALQAADSSTVPGLSELVNNFSLVSDGDLTKTCLDEPAQNSEFSSLNKKTVWIGYSLGGRLLLPFIEKYPNDLFILLSTHPGLVSEDERRGRRASDQQWADSLLAGNLSQWLDSWNQQDVLKNDPPIVCDELSLYQNELACALVNWSLAHQRNYRVVIQKNSRRILWLTGAEDKKFFQLAQTLTFANPNQVISLPGAHHRILLTHARAVIESVMKFLGEKSNA